MVNKWFPLLREYCNIRNILCRHSLYYARVGNCHHKHRSSCFLRTYTFHPALHSRHLPCSYVRILAKKGNVNPISDILT